MLQAKLRRSGFDDGGGGGDGDGDGGHRNKMSSTARPKIAEFGYSKRTGRQGESTERWLYVGGGPVSLPHGGRDQETTTRITKQSDLVNSLLSVAAELVAFEPIDKRSTSYVKKAHDKKMNTPKPHILLLLSFGS